MNLFDVRALAERFDMDAEIDGDDMVILFRDRETGEVIVAVALSS